MVKGASLFLLLRTLLINQNAYSTYLVPPCPQCACVGNPASGCTSDLIMLTVISRCSAAHRIHYLRMSPQILRMQYNSSDGSSSVDQRSTRPKSCEAQYAY